MIERRRHNQGAAANGGSRRVAYYNDDDDVEFFSSGSKTLDLALGGGWAKPRVANIIGDKSTGKTLLCIEAAANFARQYPTGKIRYRETEGAFQKSYARALGMPIERIDFGKERMHTVEDMFEELEYRVEKARDPELFIVDSLDAMTSRAELARAIDAATYRTEKATMMSLTFSRLAGKIEGRDITMMIVNQIRDKVGVQFGKKYTRGGGHALDFYASQIVYLQHLGVVTKTINKFTEVIGVEVRAKLEKNKVGNPFRESQFELLFNYGINDVGSCLDYLHKHGDKEKVLNGVAGNTIAAKEKVFRKLIMEHNDGWKTAQAKMHKTVEDRWAAHQKSFLPTKSKYAEE